ncbi:SLC13 family permease [Adhaeribacter pallidiroseus]|uniref:Putative transporter n=1 Tax=Adhaeribacter pallidiroseus TaxID=2072847 RepID=A0A369QKK2_9BACT|nr:SLC13 family permease [Adhaeribacter pallidiroseus]RDC64175.1 putative transporter [Adhaeribacter pallidiroseus]
MEIVIVLGLLLIAIVLFATEKISVDIVTLLMLIILCATRIITPEEAFAGFSSDFIVIIASVFVLSAALEETGILDFVIVKLVRVAGKNAGFMLFLVMAIAGSISAFMNNTTVTAMFVTPLVSLSRQIKTSSSKLLMPLAYASILGGTCTLIGTSTNVAVSGYIDKVGLEPVGLFEITPIGLVIFAVGLVYMMTIGRKMLPDHQDHGLTEEYKIQKYITEVVVMEESPLVGQIAYSSDLAKQKFKILNIIRNKEKFLPDHRTRIRANDIILVEGEKDDLIKIKETKGVEIMADVILEEALQSEDIRLAEILITAHSDMIRQSIKEVDFQRRYGLVVLAISRQGESIRTKIGAVRLKLGDLLLVQGSAQRLSYLSSTQHLAVLDAFTPVLFKKQKGLITVSCFLLAILIGSLGLLPLSISFLTAAVISILLKCINTDKAYSAIDWRLLILIGGMTAFGTAMERSGAATFLAQNIVSWLKPFGTTGILAGFVFLTVFLTQPMSNAAAALVIVPVALQTAATLGANPRSFAIAIMLAASVSLVTPFEPSCILVYGPGKYKFNDFLRIGSGLTLLLVVIILTMVPMFWPL